MRIIEGDMTILSDTHEYDIDRVLFQDLRIFLDLLLRISLRTYIFYAGERQLVEDGTSEEVAEALRGIGRQIHIFIHVKCMYAGPVYTFSCDYSCKNFILGRCSTKHCPHFIL